MKFLDRISGLCSELGATISTMARVVLLSRPVKGTKASPDRDLVILGNGPSLRPLLDNHLDFLENRDLMAVNFFANTPEFGTLRPEHYILADPHFFREDSTDPNVVRLWENLNGITHSMTLHIPVSRKKHPFVLRFLSGKPDRIVVLFNLTPGEGFKRWRHLLYRHGLAMPRPRNVLIPAIMQGIAAGFGKIYLAGADHTWSRTLSVDDYNRVVSIQPHFYKDNEKEQERVATEYAGYRLHDILKSLYTAFSSYHLIAPYAKVRGTEIINITPGSFIDAFPRQKL